MTCPCGHAGDPVAMSFKRMVFDLTALKALYRAKKHGTKEKACVEMVATACQGCGEVTVHEVKEAGDGIVPATNAT